MLAAGCSIQPNTSSVVAVEPERSAKAEIWEYPASAFPTTCLLLEADGSMRFRGGFVFFNPGRWTRDGATGATSLVLGGDAIFPIESPTRQTRDYASATAPFDPKTRTLRYRITAADTALEFAGLIFQRSTGCGAV